MLKRTALFEEHQKLGGRLIDFGGWELPVQYSGVMQEHLACRSAAGIFDVSHMGEVLVEGADAEAFLMFLITNDLSKIAIGQAQYTAMCHENGGIVDDLIIYKRAKDRFFVVVNAGNTDKDVNHILEIDKIFRKKNPNCDLRISNESHNYTQIAVQGPKAAAIVQKLTQLDLSQIKTYWFAEGQLNSGVPTFFARTGYTGEDGFELYVAWDQGPAVWRALFEAGKEEGITPCGLGARDTLRLEVKYPLYGHELSDETHPLEAGLGWVTSLTKGDFVGRAAIVQAKEAGLKRALVGLKLIERGIPRQGYAIYDVSGDRRIGEITSGTQSPSTKLAIGIAYVAKELSTVGTQVRVDIRGTKVLAEIIPTPFYKKPKETA